MEEIRKKLEELEKEMASLNFWQDKEKAQGVIKEISILKDKLAGKGKYDKGGAVITFFAGAGGDDAEDWVRILFEMYQKFAGARGWAVKILHEHLGAIGRLPAGRQGFKNITFEIEGKGAYGTLKNESGVHRLVRISPFSAKKLRHTSFALVEVVPKFVAPEEIEIPEKELRMEYAKASGPGGQNVNKRETAVRIIHLPTNISAHVDSERSQMQNKEKALEILKSKLYKYQAALREEERESMRISKIVEAEWGRQIRSYVFHPYKLVKDHRTNVETSDVGGVLEGKIDEFIEAEKNL